MKKIICKIMGHNWNNCTCIRCGEVRFSDHVFEYLPNSCIQKCSVCGEENVVHVYSHHRCTRCGEMDFRMKNALKGSISRNNILGVVNDVSDSDLLLLAKQSQNADVRIDATKRLTRKKKASDSDIIKNALFPNGEADNIELPDQQVLERLNNDPHDFEWLTKFDLMSVLYAVFVSENMSMTGGLFDLYKHKMYRKELEMFGDRLICSKNAVTSVNNPEWGPDSLGGNPYASSTIEKTTFTFCFYELTFIKEEEEKPFIFYTNFDKRIG